MIAQDMLFIVSPSIGFIPQIYKRNIIYSPLLSFLNIMANFFRIYHYKIEKFDIIILYQLIFGFIMHIFLIRNNKYVGNSPDVVDINHINTNRFNNFCKIISLIMIFIIFTHFLHSFGLFSQFSKVACFVEIMLSFLQYKIFKDDPKKPVELFAVWICGDIIKLIIIIYSYGAKIDFIIPTLIQLSLNISIVK